EYTRLLLFFCLPELAAVVRRAQTPARGVLGGGEGGVEVSANRARVLAGGGHQTGSRAGVREGAVVDRDGPAHRPPCAHTAGGPGGNDRRDSLPETAGCVCGSGTPCTCTGPGPGWGRRA